MTTNQTLRWLRHAATRRRLLPDGTVTTNQTLRWLRHAATRRRGKQPGDYASPPGPKGSSPAARAGRDRLLGRIFRPKVAVRKLRAPSRVIVAAVSGRKPIDRIVAAVAVMVALVFLGGLKDVWIPAPFERTVAPPPPPGAERDAVLTVTVTETREPDAGVDRGAAIPGARVRVFWTYRGRHYLAGSAKADAEGRVRFDELPRGASWVIAEADGYSRASTQLVLGGEPRNAEVALPVAHRLRIDVADENGAPVEGATVLATGGDPLPFGALSDRAGVAELDRLGPSPWTVKVGARGYESVTRSGVVRDAAFTLRRLGSIEVRVVSESGEPAPGAKVVIAGSALWPAREAETDAEGGTRIAGLLAGAYDLRASLGDRVSETMLGLELGRGEDARATLTLRPGRMITALVTDGDDDAPVVVASADVVLVEGGLSSFPLMGRTGTDGTVTLGPLPPGPATLGARARGFVPRAAVSVPAEPRGSIRIALLRGGRLLGEVVDKSGDPVDGASVEVVGVDIDGLPVSETPVLIAFRDRHFEWALGGPTPLIPAGELGVMAGPIPPIPRGGAAPDEAPAAGAAIVPSDTPPIEPWVTRHDGRFTASPVTPGRVRALVRHPSYVEALSDAVTLGPGGEASVRVVMLAGGKVEGRLLDEAGQPVSGARIDLTAARGTLHRTTLTAADGSFAFAAVPEEVVLAVARPDAPERMVLRTTLEVEEGGKEVVELTLPRTRSAVRVVVRDADGAPVDTAQVTVASLDPSVPLRQTFFTGSEGVVAVPDARGLHLRVVVEAPGWARSIRVTDAAGEELSFALEKGVIVVGEVTAVRGRTVVSGAGVTLLQGGARQRSLTDANGAYRFRDVTPGAVRLVVSHPDFAPVEVTRTVVTTGRPDRELELDAIDLSEPGVIEGEVVDADGEPVVGARVAIGVAPAYLPAGALPPGIALTDTRGRFTLRGVPGGSIDVEAYAADIGRGRKEAVSVSSGAATRGVRIRLSGETGATEPPTTGSVAVTLGERTGEDGANEVVVVHVASSSDAENAGLATGDVIAAVDGAVPSTMNDARARLSGPEGSDVVVTIVRGDGEVVLRVRRERVRR